MIIFAVVAWFVTTRTPFGRAVYAVGGNERSAELSGVRVNRTKMLVYMISGFCAATVGLIISSQLVAAHPATGQFFELNAIAAVVLGGTSLAGGRGTIVGTIIGAFVIGVLTVGLNQLGVSSFWQQIIKGLGHRARPDHRPAPAARRAPPGAPAAGRPDQPAHDAPTPTSARAERRDDPAERMEAAGERTGAPGFR